MLRHVAARASNVRILIISSVFAPYNVVGAVRASKFAKYLTRFGHDVRVITQRNHFCPATLPLEISARNVSYTHWLNFFIGLRHHSNLPYETGLNNLFVGLRPMDGKAVKFHLGSEWRPVRLESASGQVRPHLGAVLSFNDVMTGWYPFAYAAAVRLARRWKPDIVFATSPPPTALIVGRSVAHTLNIPWVADLRDPWMDDPCRLQFR